MSITIECECGQKLRAKDTQAGKTLSCPQCGRPIVVAQNGDANDVSPHPQENPFDIDRAPPTAAPPNTTQTRPAQWDERPRGVSLKTATLVAIVSIILTMLLHLIELLRYGIQLRYGILLDFEYVRTIQFLLSPLKFYVGFGGLLFFLFVLRAKQSR